MRSVGEPVEWLGKGVTSIDSLPNEGSISTCSVAATYKPSMLVPRARLPAGAYDTPRASFMWQAGEGSAC